MLMSDNFAEQLARLPSLLAPHVELTVIALLMGVLLSVPCGLLLTRLRTTRALALGAAAVIQTTPALALLALMVPTLEMLSRLGVDISSFGFVPAVIALTLYSILPILRNTVAGVEGVDPAIIEAARGVGMTPTQIMFRIELPLALPVLIAGIRTAAVWVVGIATLATPVGQPCLGNYIFTGLQTRNWVMVLFGVVCAALLAILIDALIAAMQRAAERRSPTLGLAALVGLLALFVAGLAAPVWSALWPSDAEQPSQAPRHDVQRPDRDRPAIRIGAKTFTEQYVLAELLARTLRNHGFEIQKTESLGSTIIFDQLRARNLDVYIDYSGTLWSNAMERSGTAPAQVVLDELAWWLAREHGIRQLGSLGFENAYALAMRRDDAERLGVDSVADLADHADDMRIGGDYEFFSRPEWKQVEQAYALSFRREVSYDSTLMYEAIDQGEVDVIAAFSSDGRIAAYDLLVLEDPKQAIPPYDAVLLLGPTVADDPDVVDALRPLVGSIDLSLMQSVNAEVDVEGRSISNAAKRLERRIHADGGDP